jgi:beta-1,4-N-acetylglucosaminyltransferase
LIYVTLGTMFLEFPRLVRMMDEIARATGEEIIMQTGMGKTLPSACAHFDFKPHDDVLAIQREARVIVCHAGIGSVLDALHVRRPLIVVPRLKKYGEHMNDHQIDLARAVERRGWGRMILDIEDLPSACAQPPPVPAAYVPAKARLIASLREVIEGMAAKKPLH